MKKLSTLVAATLMALTANAQETWSADQLTAAPTEASVTATTDNVTLKSLSSPNDDQLKDGYWQIKGGGNTTISDTFQHYLMGKGNPAITHEEKDEETDNGTAHRVYETYWAPGNETLPIRGTYHEITTKKDGTLTVVVYVNKGNHNLYIINETKTDAGYQVVKNTDISVNFCYQNNTFTYDGTNIWNKGTMADDYILQHTNGVTQNRPAMGSITFAVKANTTYMLMNPKSQLGIYGFTFTPSTSAGIGKVKVENNVNAPIYNLAGQRVSKSYKGVVIQNGKKHIQ